MEYTEKLKETTDRFYKEVKEIGKLNTYSDIDSAERKCVEYLQALQVLVAESGRDLYSAVQTRKKELAADSIVVVKKQANGRGKNSK